MLKILLGLFIAAAILLGSLMALRRNKDRDLPSADVIARVKRREEQLEAQERAEREE